MEELDYLSNLSLPFEEEIEGDYLSTGARALGDYISTLPKAKEINGPLIREGSRVFEIDAGNYIHRVVVGITEKHDRFIVVAGDSSPYRVKEHEGKSIVFLPPLLYKCSKLDKKKMPPHQLQAKMAKEALVGLRAGLNKAGFRDEKSLKLLDKCIDSDFSLVAKRYGKSRKAHGKDVVIPKQFVSNPNFCPKGNCVKCRDVVRRVDDAHGTKKKKNNNIADRNLKNCNNIVVDPHVEKKNTTTTIRDHAHDSTSEDVNFKNIERQRIMCTLSVETVDEIVRNWHGANKRPLTVMLELGPGKVLNQVVEERDSSKEKMVKGTVKRCLDDEVCSSANLKKRNKLVIKVEGDEEFIKVKEELC